MLAHAVLHGHSLATVQALIAPGRPWHTGLAGAYTRYDHNAAKALERDFTKALNWAATNGQFFRPLRAQEQVHTRGKAAGPQLHRAWLANALAWLDKEYRGHRYRWIGAAVYQALAIHAVRAGDVINGVPVVGVGGRSLSIATGLLSETTVWQFLRETRDQPGSPLVRTRIAQGRQPDYYALTAQTNWTWNRRPSHEPALKTSTPPGKSSATATDASTSSSSHHELTKPEEIFAAAHTNTSTGYTTLAALSTAGLITGARGQVSIGPVSLDNIAAAHHLDEQRAERIERHHRERAIWRNWLALRENAPTDDADHVNDPQACTEPPDPHRAEYLTAVLTTGPPTIDEEHDALQLLADLVGGRVVATV